MKVRLHWSTRDDRTGTYDTEVPESEEAPGLPEMYMWEDGNNSCDCNRAQMFLGERWDCGMALIITKIEIIGADGSVTVYCDTPEEPQYDYVP